MKSKSLKLAMPALVLAVLGSAYIVSLHAQQPANNSSASLMTTNWTGYLVVGTDETIDRMPLRRPDLKAVVEVELGLRSDGVVVWRRASKAK